MVVKKTIMGLLLAFLALFYTQVEAAPKKRFVFIVPSHQNKEFYKRNLDSIFSQTCDDYRVIYIDDASSDGTGILVKEYAQKKGQAHRVEVIINDQNKGALANIFKAVWSCSPHEIIVNLDGDDWMAHRDVLAQLSKVYADPQVWMTYGQFIYYPSYKPGFGAAIPSHVIEQNLFRSSNQGTTALRTFYAGLFQKIKQEDLMYKGDFFRVGYDLAMMLPMLEMAGHHSRFIPDIGYVYNIHTPLNDHKTKAEEQAEVDHYLRQKEKYQSLVHYAQKQLAKTIYITPGWWGQLFAVDNPAFNRDNCLEVMVRLREAAAEAGYELLQADSLASLPPFEYLIIFDVFPDQLSYLDRYPKEKLILFLWEPPSVHPTNYNVAYHELFSKVFTWNDDLVDGKKYFKFYYPVYRPMIPEPVDFFTRRTCTLVACNKHSSYPGELYSERRRVIQFFETLPDADFDLYGKGWEASFKHYQGAIDRKIDYLKYYKFCFAYENVRGVPGYITEKIFDCFQAGTVPVYWGAPNISQYIPKNCYIARADFKDEAELYRYLRYMTPQVHAEYLKNIQLFLNSKEAQLYSIDHFIENFIHLIKSATSEEAKSP
ncbi:MAG: glycosyltransferase [Verrucomicrobia bacterium]|nr:glycosyltransferase [Verrucomicrobiota bacterium]